MSLRLTSSALALMAFAMPAFADVTPEEVWQTWVDYYKSTGYTVTEGGHDLAGETLTLKDVKFANESDGDKVEFTVPQITLQSTGDGKVRTTYAESFPVSISGKNADDEAFSTDLTVSLPGNSTVTSGAKGDLVNEMSLPELTVTVDKLQSGDKTQDLNVKFTATNSTGTAHTVAGAEGKYDYKMKSEKATIAISGEPDGPGKGDLNLNFAMDALDMDFTGLGMDAIAGAQADLGAALEKGLSLAGTFKSGKTAFDFNVDKPADAETQTEAETVKGTGTIDAFDLTFKMSKDGLVYQGNGDKTAAQLTANSLPFPVTYGINSSSFDFQMPVAKSDADQPFKFAYSLNGLTLGDEIWNLFDPTKQLSRDPANLDIDITGKGKVVANLFDEKALTGETDADGDETAAAQPFEPSEVTINQLALSAVGAKVSATGTLKPAGDGGIETPVGSLNARYEGVNGLIDNLGKMGLIPDDQMAGVRMMLAMFARPADGNDVLTTDLEFKEDGSVFANGQQVK
ncbi:DUF2125 domain-containing protein [Paracoccus aminophilus]|uniref:DUF2125 domain-containing protein n=1 Tax=Paracoccus aminophilus JCM 7686 TaxID=1367847 RepID=S5Z1I0_PARAH|nr:DUF2125 domain-containing protein [Paracoccus aminophilus]AGT11301.1 hypothetical protein JCM7686_pAMI5p235 [Paracoccus aminophilus JCM 7686]